jgi:hypothetical protein
MPDRQFSEGERERLAREGHALKDGSFPMPDCDAVRRSISSYGRAPDSHRAELAALIRRRNAELHCGHDLDVLAAD